MIKKEKPKLKKYNRSNQIYGSKYSVYPHYNIKNFLSLTSKYPILFSIYSELKKFNSLNPPKAQDAQKKKNTVDGNASELYDEYPEIYFNRYMTLSYARKRKFSDILEVYFLIDMVIVRGQKIKKNRLMKKNL